MNHIARGAWRRRAQRVLLVTALTATACLPAFADDVTFKDKTITMIIGSAPGGGTDATGRVLQPFLAKHLPGQPQIVVRNMPGADGVTALNYVTKVTKPDGLTLMVGSSTNVDPLNYRKPQAQFDPVTFRFIGGVGRGGTMMLIRRDAEARLHDKTREPVVMGSVGGVPRSGMQLTAWGIKFLGWNARWVVGYRGTNDLAIALDRGEIEMTSTGNMFQIRQFVEGKTVRVLFQSGTFESGQLVARPEFADAPIFSDYMKGKISDPTARKAFDYWFNSNAMDKWVAVVHETPQPIVDAYRKAFEDIHKDLEFGDTGKKISEDFTLLSYKDTEYLVKALGDTPTPALNYMADVLRSQGLHVEQE